MNITSRQRNIKTAVYFIIIALIAVIQSTPGFTFEIAGARCFLLIPVCIILGMGEDEGLAAAMGLFGGLLWDATTSVHLGFNAVFLCLSCLISSTLVTFILRNTFIANLVFSAISAFAYALMYWLFFIVIKGINGAELSIIYFYFPSAFYTAALFPIIWLCVTPLKRRLNSPVKSLN